MSAKNRKKKSDPFDRYYTPMGLALAGMGHLRRTRPEFFERVETVLEPGCGPGTFCSAALSTLPGLKKKPIGVDVAPPTYRYPDFELVKRNYLGWNTKRRFDLIPTNPPFTHANECIRRSVTQLAPGGLCMFLMRIGVVGGIDRSAMWQEDINLIEVCMVAPRPGFTYDGETDASEYAFFLFNGEQPRSTETRMRWLNWDNR